MGDGYPYVQVYVFCFISFLFKIQFMNYKKLYLINKYIYISVTYQLLLINLEK